MVDLDEILSKLRHAAAKHVTREYRHVSLGEHECRILLVALQASPAAVPAGYVPVPVETLLDFKAWFSTSSPIGIALRKRVDELLAAARKGE